MRAKKSPLCCITSRRVRTLVTSYNLNGMAKLRTLHGNVSKTVISQLNKKVINIERLISRVTPFNLRYRHIFMSGWWCLGGVRWGVGCQSRIYMSLKVCAWIITLNDRKLVNLFRSWSVKVAPALAAPFRRYRRCKVIVGKLTCYTCAPPCIILAWFGTLRGGAHEVFSLPDYGSVWDTSNF